ncbi:putative transcription factor cmr1 protein [Daldinia childiae]|uniref:putative transcription factor cmr1 protein n=1 Tax=Daldinia childiae TaxID=326645 RepID=UPI0014489DD2|nr:putative transcription factor cmr1 protein [Daldinia childiae]KAF3057933.1 putative transcription factor cmr1 protein [Daldinia childiae]
MLQNNQAAALLVLLMIAQGANAVPTAEARALSAGLIETCRISLFDIIEKDIEMCADPTALRCALLFMLLGAWSGDKWLMDIAMGQRGMYLSMLKHAGMFESQPSMIPTFSSSTNAELQWRSWLHRESQNRLVYNFVMVDQELSLFHDTAPMLSTSELCAPLPGPELLWMSANADQWVAAVQSIYGCTANVNPQLLTTPPSLTPSLYDLFQDLLNDNLPAYTTSQMLSCFSDVMGTRRIGNRTGIKSSFESRRDEIQVLLQKWYELTITYYKANPTCATSKTNLVLYHLISLNAITNFPEIERLARREGFDGSYWELSLRHKRCISQREEAIFHCGQVFRLLRRSMPRDRRPSWWSAGVYRATLILWTDSVSRLDPNFQKRDESGPPVPIDQVTPEDPAVITYLWNGEGVPVLTHQRDGTRASLEKPGDVLEYAVKTLEDGSSRFTDGVRRKLVALSGNWQADGLHGAGATVQASATSLC